MPRGRPQASRLRQVESYLRDMWSPESMASCLGDGQLEAEEVLS